MTGRWRGIAYNQVPNSTNQIHDDDMAKRFGFKGGLVPGVTVSAYLLHPVADVFGIEFLERGYAHCRINSPLYDDEPFEVEITDRGLQHCHTKLIRGADEPLARAETGIRPDSLPPVYRGDDIGTESIQTPATSRKFEQLRSRGCLAFRYRWDTEHEMSSYLREPSAMLDLYAIDGFANPSYVLGISNWVLSANVYMNPWVHLETRSQNFAPIAAGTSIIAEMSVKGLFEKKEHEFVDVEVNVFDANSLRCYAAINLRAIYLLRGA